MPPREPAVNHSSRRTFLQSLAAASLGSAAPAYPGCLHAEALSILFAEAQSGTPQTLFPADAIAAAIFPRPQQIASSGGDFLLDDQVRIVVPMNPSAEDLSLAHFLRNEVNDRFGLVLSIEHRAQVSGPERFIVMGSEENALAGKYARSLADVGTSAPPGPEGYLLRVDRNRVVVVGSDDRGAFYGLQSLRQLLFKDGGEVRIRGAAVRDWPDKAFRGIYLYLPGRANIPFFKRFVQDYVALYKFNTLIVEMNANMRLESHPELNSGWRDLIRDTNYSFRNYPPGPLHDVEQNSSHQDNADGDILEKEEVAELAGWIAKHHIELVPELASFTHSYHLLASHKDLAAVPEDKWPDIYCASNPKSYELVYEVYDEFIDLLKPKMIHIGHDELFLAVDASPRCKDGDIGELYGQDVKNIHDHLSARGIRTALWGDMLLESVRGRGLRNKRARDGWKYATPGGLTREQVERLIPKDCLIFNWFWNEEPEEGGGTGEVNEDLLDKMGFTQIYGNFEPTIQNYETRKKRTTLIGGAPSAWFATNELGFGKELMSTFLSCSSILWTGHVLGARELSGKVQAMMPAIRSRLSGIVPPSLTESSIAPLDISKFLNSSGKSAELSMDASRMETGTVSLGNVHFDLRTSGGLQAIVVGAAGKTRTSLPTTAAGIPVGTSPLSVIFLHASARPAANRESFRALWDQQDTADMLGWYEVVYEDGFVTTIPIRYGVHLLEWNWDERTSANSYCYGADAVPVGAVPRDRITLFACEWTNPRFGKVIREIRLHGTTAFRSASADYGNEAGALIENNAVLLRAITLVQKRG
jgi:hypothetical protein